MGVRVMNLSDPDTDKAEGACLFCSVNGTVFGRRFHDVNEADDFLEWLGCDPRPVDEANRLEDARTAYDTAAAIGFTGLMRGQWAEQEGFLPSSGKRANPIGDFAAAIESGAVAAA